MIITLEQDQFFFQIAYGGVKIPFPSFGVTVEGKAMLAGELENPLFIQEKKTND